MSIIYLEITTFADIGIGIHYYGTLSSENFDIDDVDLDYKMTQKQAIAFTKRDGREFKYRPGMTSQRFFSTGTLIEKAKEVYKQHFPEAELLILGETYISQPQLVLACTSKKDMVALNKIFAEFDTYDWDNPNEEKRMEELRKDWYKILNKYKKEN